LVPEQQAAPAIRKQISSAKIQQVIEEAVARLRQQGSVEILIPL
jgi:hypothetical protein